MPEDAKKGGLYRNAISFFGAYVAIVSVFLILFSLLLQFSFKSHSPYIGIFSFMVFPAFFTLGAILFLYGMRRESIRRRRHGVDEALLADLLPPTFDEGDTWDVISHGNIDALSYLRHAIKAMQTVRLGVAEHEIVAGRADEILNRKEGLPGCRPGIGPWVLQIHPQASAELLILHPVSACAAIVGIDACAADQDVIARAAVERIGPAAAKQDVVTVIAGHNIGEIVTGKDVVGLRAEQVFDTGIGVTRSLARVDLRGCQVRVQA